jgi:hypothetical protein
MARKKLSEMTPYERVDSRIKGMSWEEAEDVGVEILSRCIALHIFAREDIEEYLPKVFHRIRERACEWASHEGSFPLAMAKSAVRHQKEMEKKTKIIPINSH